MFALKQLRAKYGEWGQYANVGTITQLLLHMSHVNREALCYDFKKRQPHFHSVTNSEVMVGSLQGNALRNIYISYVDI